MRISDWSSDVCSSDLLAVAQEVVPVSLAPIWRIEGQNNANIAVFRGFDLGAKGQVIGRLPHRLVGLGAFAPVTPAIRVRGPVRPRQADAITHPAFRPRSEEHTSELQSLMRISYAVFCLKKKKRTTTTNNMTIIFTYQKHIDCN